MAINDGFPPDRSPLFLSEHPEKNEQVDIGRALNRATISSRVLKASMLAVTATAIGIAILAVADPVEILGNVTALWVEKSAPQPDAEPPAPTTQSIASTQDLPPAPDTPARDETAAAVEPATDPGQAETGQPVTEALFRQFQAWAAEEESRAKVEPVQPAQAAPVQAQQDPPAQVHTTKRHRRARSLQNARAEIRPHRNHRARVRQEQTAPMPIAPVPDPRAQEQAVQNSQTPWLLQSLGFRN
jgi:hypothetical protein